MPTAAHHATLSSMAMLLAAVLCVVGCADGADCGEGLVLQAGVCVVAIENGEDEPGAEDAAVDAGSLRPGVEDGFTDRCTDDVDHSDCTGAADYCAIMPNATEGTCTATGCVDDDTVCPDGWGCFDVGLLVDGAPSICIEP